MSQAIEKRVMLDLDLCVECRSCSAACYYGHLDLPTLRQRIDELQDELLATLSEH